MKSALDKESKAKVFDAAVDSDRAQYKVLTYYEVIRSNRLMSTSWVSSLLFPAPLKACLDLKGRVESLEGGPLLNILREPKIGGWKITQRGAEPEVVDKERWRRKKKTVKKRPSVKKIVTSLRFLRSFQRKLEFLQRAYQTLGFFSWSVGEDDKNSTRHIIQVRKDYILITYSIRK